MKRSVVSVVLLSLLLSAAFGVLAASHAKPHRKAPPAKKSAPAKPAPKPVAIAWNGYEDGLAVARRQNKAALVDFYTTWCGWCKKLDSDVYTDKTVIALSDRVIFIKVDAERRADIAKKYRVNGFPTIVILNPKGKEVHRIVGYEPASQFVADVRKAIR